jgi:hypothetical protein
MPTESQQASTRCRRNRQCANQKAYQLTTWYYTTLRHIHLIDLQRHFDLNNGDDAGVGDPEALYGIRDELLKDSLHSQGVFHIGKWLLNKVAVKLCYSELLHVRRNTIHHHHFQRVFNVVYYVSWQSTMR